MISINVPQILRNTVIALWNEAYASLTPLDQLDSEIHAQSHVFAVFEFHVKQGTHTFVGYPILGTGAEHHSQLHQLSIT